MALTDNLQAFYKLSDTSDSSGNNRTLTNNGNVSFASGKIGNAAVFDGTNSLTFDLPEMTDLSCSFWVKFNSINSDISILGKLANDFFGVYYDAAGQRMLIVRHGIGEMIGNEFVPQIGIWYFISVTRSGSSFKLNINGSSSNNDSGDSASFNSGTYAISVNPNDTYASGQVLDGQIDAVGIWNRALSDAEVAELYNNGTGLELPAAPAVKNGWINNIYWINDVATTLDQNGDGTWVGKLYENGSLFSGSKYSLTFVDGVAQAEEIVTVIGSNIPVAFGLNEAEEPLVELVFSSITSAGETTVEQIAPTVLPVGIPAQYTAAQTVLAYSIDTTATFEGTINVDFVLPSSVSQAVFDRVKAFHVKNNGTTEEMARVSSDFSTKRITVAISSFSSFFFMDEPQVNKSVKVIGKSKFVGKIKFA